MNNTLNATFLEKLRHATAQAHQDLENLPLSASIINPEVTNIQYTAYLQLMLDVVYDTEQNIFPLLENIVPDLEARRKAHHISADLKYLEHNSSTLRSKPVTEGIENISPAFALGVMYVVEGSSLGGRVILKNINAVLGHDAEKGASYFSGYGGQTGSHWKGFLAALTDFENKTCNGEAIIAGANHTFNVINTHFRLNAPSGI